MSEAQILIPFAGSRVRDMGVDHGVYWVTVNAPVFEAVNGYIRLPKDHPLTEQQVDEMDLDVPGGITYASEDDHGYLWIGFDTLHAGDYWPGMPEWNLDAPGRIDWTPEMVASEAATIARQVGLLA